MLNEIKNRISYIDHQQRPTRHVQFAEMLIRLASLISKREGCGLAMITKNNTSGLKLLLLLFLIDLSSEIVRESSLLIEMLI